MKNQIKKNKQWSSPEEVFCEKKPTKKPVVEDGGKMAEILAERWRVKQQVGRRRARRKMAQKQGLGNLAKFRQGLVETNKKSWL